MYKKDTREAPSEVFEHADLFSKANEDAGELISDEDAGLFSEKETQP